MNDLDRMLSFAGRYEDSDHWMRMTVIYALLFSILISLLFYLISSHIMLSVLVFVLSLFGVPIFRYLLIELAIENRKREVEHILPDFLRVVASNVRAGLTPLVALRAAARPEFGILSIEIQYFVTRVMGSRSVESVFKEVQNRVRSPLLARVFKAFMVSLRSGGNLAKTLETSASDIQRMYELHESLVARVSMYIMFILFGVLFTMPFLLAVSINILELMAGISSTMTSSYAASFISVTSPQIDIVFLQSISILILIGSSLSASVLMSVINTGSRITGIKYFVPIMLLSLFLFYISKDYVVPFLISALGGGF